MRTIAILNLKGGVGKNAGYLNSIWEYSNPASGWM